MTLQGCPPAAKGLSCEEEKKQCENECKEKAETPASDFEDDVMFTGIKARQGNTTIMQGERIAAPLSAFQGGDLKPEDLEPFRKHIVSSTNANGTVSVSTSSSQKGWIFGSHSQDTQNTDVHSGVTITTRKSND